MKKQLTSIARQLFYFIAPLLLVSCKVNHIADVHVSTYRVAEMEQVREDSFALAMIAPYKVQVVSEMDKVIGRATETMYKELPEGTLGNWMADVVLHQGRMYDGGSIDCALLNSGGIRIPALQAGDITKGLVFELMPFDNQLVVVEMSGEILTQLADRIAEKGGWPISDGLTFGIREGRAIQIMIQGKAITPSQTYRVLLPDYIANGGDDCFFLKDQPQKELGVLVRDAIIEKIMEDTRKGKDQEPGILGRISIP